MKSAKQRVQEYRQRKKNQRENALKDLELLKFNLIKLDVMLSGSLASCVENDCDIEGARSVLANSQKIASRIDI